MMKANRSAAILAGILVSGLLCGFSSMALGQEGPPPAAAFEAPLDPGIKATFVPLGAGVPGVLYAPVDADSKAAIAVLVMHAEGDYLRFSACTELSRRGYTVLCANTRTPKSMASLDLNLDEILLDVKAGVTYLRKQPAIKKVVLFGHSGGGAMMSAYQNIAENGLGACQGAEKIHKCSDKLAGLPAADGVILADANWGLAAMTLFSLDPAVSDEGNARSINPDLDLFNPKNGFDPAGTSYSDEFIRKFQGAVGQRNNRIVDSALARWALIQAGQGNYVDDEPFVVPGAVLFGFNNKLFAQDTRLLSHTRKAWPLLHADGSLSNEIVHSVRVPEGKASLTPSLGAALRGTVRTFLTTFAIRTTDDYGFDEDSVHGIDWASNYSCPAGNTPGISKPLLAMGMTGHWEFLAAEALYENAGSRDKSLVFVEGAGHTYATCTKCEKTSGQYGDTVKTTYDYVAGWLGMKGRFLD